MENRIRPHLLAVIAVLALFSAMKMLAAPPVHTRAQAAQHLAALAMQWLMPHSSRASASAII